MEVRDWNVLGNSSIDAMKEKGSTEIISKYNNYEITEIVTDLRRNEVTEISKITKETLESIIGGCVVRLNSQDILENDNTTRTSEPMKDNCFTGDTLKVLEDASEFTDIKMPSSQNSTELSKKRKDNTGDCYVRVELNRIIETLQNEGKKVSKSQKRKFRRGQFETKSISILEQTGDNSRSFSDLARQAGKIEHANHNQLFESMNMRDCYVNIKIDQEIEKMQNKIRKTSKKENRNIYSIFSQKCYENRENKKIVRSKSTEKCIQLSTNSGGMKRKKVIDCYKDQDNCQDELHSRCEYVNLKMENKSYISATFNSFFPSNKLIKKVLNDMCHYQKENNILMHENLRIENSLVKARSRIKLLKKKLKNFERINNYTFLKKYFKENEITALLGNCEIDWCDKMITKALQLRFACGNEGYEKLLKGVNLPSLKMLRNRVHDSKFDLALLAKKMIQF